jgi:hypothetical protein
MNRLALNRGARLVWAAVGAAMVAAGARRRSLWDLGCSAAGSSMLLWAFAAPAVPSAPVRDMVDIASEDSFPASDPPSTW